MQAARTDPQPTLTSSPKTSGLSGVEKQLFINQQDVRLSDKWILRPGLKNAFWHLAR
jgi:hypothetical protein